MHPLPKSGFTLIEILLVVIIMSILVAIAAPNISKKGQQARIAATKAEIEGTLTLALDLYQLDAGRFPSTEQGLGALIEAPNLPPKPISWNGPYLKKLEIPKDEWKNEYIYECPGNNNADFDLNSMGKDGIVGNEDDINNWAQE
jgi:general secretion pathway protein G